MVSRSNFQPWLLVRFVVDGCQTPAVGDFAKTHQVGSPHALLTGKPMQLAMILSGGISWNRTFMSSRGFAELGQRRCTCQRAYLSTP